MATGPAACKCMCGVAGLCCQGQNCFLSFTLLSRMAGLQIASQIMQQADSSNHERTKVVEESRRECAAALRFLAEVKLAFPEVLQAIKTKQLAQEILLFKEDHIVNLAKTGAGA